MWIDRHDDGLEDGPTIEQVIDFCKDAKAAGVEAEGKGKSHPGRSGGDGNRVQALQQR